MDQIWVWAGTVDWSAVTIDIAIPVLAILVPTFIALSLARAERARAEAVRRADLTDREVERRAATAARETERRAVAAAREAERRERYRDRRREAGAGVIVALAKLISIHPSDPAMQGELADLRGHLGVYRAWIEPDEDHSGDWLALQHTKGMSLWSSAMETIAAQGEINRIADHELPSIMDPARQWAQDTIETFTAWLAGDLGEDVLRRQGAAILASMTSRTPSA